jgi:hypothetical protein
MASSKTARAALPRDAVGDPLEQLGGQLDRANTSIETGRKRPRDGNAEARIQADVIAWIREIAPGVVAFYIPNDVRVSKREASRLKWLGLLPGIPDICIIDRLGAVFFIEVKTPIGTVSPAQQQVMDRLISLSAPCAVVRSAAELPALFDRWGIATMEAGR